ncbi:hypothetical protein AFAEC_2169 [Aliarcobacter faecis]|uniref:RCC1-like domain-containing protein n=1 Tax=Aliarcobacter faecis TaxID=1564138 RepID=UPI000483E0ED|nr:RCC1 domain-containing protein [Aliarcobacter faecis]QKF74313.1 hypothetical protein AFAEC_2169 [Aliarcobacter faecis]
MAINKYILQNGKIPKKSDNSLDWDKLMTSDYLGTNFNKYNPITKQNIVVTFDSNNIAFIKGVFLDDKNYTSELNYLYNFYINKIFRVNTIPPKDNTKAELVKGSQVLYSKIQNEIVNIINENKNKIFLPTQDCEIGNYYYELKSESLIYKYCKTAISSIEIYQAAPIYLDNLDDLKYIRVGIGEKAYIKDGISWYEYYYEGNGSWIPLGTGRTTGQINDQLSIEDRILSYIPDAKDLVLRRDGGCMLANGDIFCWGNNRYKKVGIENYGQLDTTIKPDYVNTPVMLKVQIEDSVQNNKRWYNNPYRIKFEKMAMNSTNVCGISPIFNYFEGTQKKFGGDLYCNGQITPLYFENISTGSNETSILGKNKFFGWGKSDKTDDPPKLIKISEDGGPIEKNSLGEELTITRDEIYLTDIVMVEDTIAVLSDDGKIYTIGKNYNGALGIGSDDKFIIQSTPKEVKNNDVLFKKIFALRDIATFGAIDSNNYFYIWGERPNGKVYYEPTIVSNSLKFNPDGIFTNSKDFLLKAVNNSFYRTKNNIDLVPISAIPSTAISASIYDNNSTELYIYVNENMVLEGNNDFLVCKESNSSNCDTTDTAIFKTALNELNSITNRFNGKDYANFANVSIYRLDTVKAETFEDFENKSTTGWSRNTITTIPNNGDLTKVPATTFLGRFPTNSPCTGNPCSDESPFSVTKTYTFSQYPNHEVEIEFDFYEIGSWDGERFEIYANGVLLAQDHFIWDGHAFMKDSNVTGIYLQDNISLISGHNYNQTYKYKLKSKLNNAGQLQLEFKTSLEFQGNNTETNQSDYQKKPPLYGNYWSKFDEGLSNESWGIDNIRIKVKETNKIFVCSMTSMGSASQMYCWGNIGRGVPILSTSLYDVAKISTINKLFVTQESEKTSQMAFDKFNDSGNLFLKYPTYIGGFDYPFYFK